jgi:signal transduction histidine kinase
VTWCAGPSSRAVLTRSPALPSRASIPGRPGYIRGSQDAHRGGAVPGRDDRGTGDAGESGEDLVLSLCHEVGNLVGAIRLNADLIDSEASPLDLASAAVEIDDCSARIRSWLALVRPLLDRERVQEAGVSPEALIRGVAETLDECGSRAVSVETEVAPRLGRVRGRQETLHHLLATLAFHAVEEARPAGRVWLRASAAADGVVRLCVEDDGPEDAGLHAREAGALTGRALALAAGAAILARVGGQAEAERSGGRTAVSLRLPLLE